MFNTLVMRTRVFPCRTWLLTGELYLRLGQLEAAELCANEARQVGGNTKLKSPVRFYYCDTRSTRCPTSSFT